MDEKFLIANNLVPDNEVWVSPKTFENPFSKNIAEASKPSHNTGSLQLLLDGFKKDYPSLSQKTIHAVNAFVLYAQQQQAGA
ncbi:hypothetical protein [Sulfuricurvum sp.]|uniref:hypothetical protein n=1 Tax=Sulfuricurvum sp. TaxID=2025608 RepID=UPI00356B5A9E